MRVFRYYYMGISATIKFAPKYRNAENIRTRSPFVCKSWRWNGVEVERNMKPFVRVHFYYMHQFRNTNVLQGNKRLCNCRVKWNKNNSRVYNHKILLCIRKNNLLNCFILNWNIVVYDNTWLLRVANCWIIKIYYVNYLIYIFLSLFIFFFLNKYSWLYFRLNLISSINSNAKKTHTFKIQ